MTAHYFVVSDTMGFVGAFATAAEAKAVIDEYTMVPFLVQRFAADPSCDLGTIWVVLYRDINAVAFVSNNKAEAERVRDMYGAVGYTYADDLKYWEQPVGKVNELCKDHLASLARAHAMYAMPEDTESPLEKLAKIERLNRETPLTRLLHETEPITIMDCVVPMAAPAAATAATAEPAPAAAAAAAEPAAPLCSARENNIAVDDIDPADIPETTAVPRKPIMTEAERTDIIDRMRVRIQAPARSQKKATRIAEARKAFDVAGPAKSRVRFSEHAAPDAAAAPAPAPDAAAAPAPDAVAASDDEGVPPVEEKTPDIEEWVRAFNETRASLGWQSAPAPVTEDGFADMPPLEDAPAPDAQSVS